MKNSSKSLLYLVAVFIALLMTEMSGKKILFIHGLESGVLGKKAGYLRQYYGSENVLVPAMETGMYSTSKSSFFMHGVYKDT